ncbi:MAG: hypothetical protein M1829_005908 [Trizodia sp. TS-e1964]|nr:MAG: hypothetical protein M1829_005908 [Trizodia sp. TS-e1964]
MEVFLSSARLLRPPDRLHHLSVIYRSLSSAPSPTELLTRQLPALHDTFSPQHSSLLDLTLASFLPPLTPRRPSSGLPPGHHLVYFPPPIATAALLPDGTDAVHSPGPPYTERLWGGGQLSFSPAPLDSQPRICTERIARVQERQPGCLRVTLERHIRVPNQSPEIVELRDLVFQTAQQARRTARKGARELIYPHEPAHRHVLVPTRELLFRFSALSFNAHRIHLSDEYCRAQGYVRGLIVHGPLCVVLLLEFLARAVLPKGAVIAGFEYRNLAPLHAGEEMTLCARLLARGRWEAWIVGPKGGLAVRGVVTLDEVSGVS